ncbi:response regulator [Sphingomonas paucimobilis]|uniref:Response regulator n=1 Tax=Sphingomonas paucimobilis TaxID=13689 RepID=A0A7Y2KLZ1_SPHPI|nr:response regulator [Sphingomonas paucimobilis]NNG56427.1 response regulator [Sphingomonas paucimobilis]
MSDLEGKRILVLDDEPLIVMLLEDILADLRCAVVGPVLDVAEAEKLARTAEIDAAILDLNVHDRTTHSVAELLKARGIPFVIASGYDGDGGLAGADGTLNKPFGPDRVKAALLGLLG